MIKADYIFIAALVLFIGAHITTGFLIKYYEDAAEAVGIAKSIALEYETNPVARWFFSLIDIKIMYSYVIMPGVLTALYWFIRHKYNKEPVAIEAYAIAFFMFGLLSFLNDLSLAVGVLL